MTNMTAYPVSIHRLTLRARSAQQRQIDALQQELQQMVWPQANDEQWVFIRHMQVRGPRRQLQRRLSERTRYFLNQTENPAEVIRFDNLEVLLVALLSDVLDGKAGFRWYWQNWAHFFTVPVSQAIRQILSEHLVLMPSLTDKLAQRGDLQKLWQCLDQSGSRQLALELSHLGRFRLPEPGEIINAYIKQVQQVKQTQHIDNQTSSQSHWSVLTTGQLQSRMAAARIKQWQSILNDMDLSDSRCLLALLIIGQEIMPLLLQKQPVQLLASVAGCFSIQPISRNSLPENKTSVQHVTGLEKDTDERIVALNARQSSQVMDQEDLFSLNDTLQLDRTERSGSISPSASLRKENQVNEKVSKGDALEDATVMRHSVKTANWPEMSGGRKDAPLKWQIHDSSIQSGSFTFSHFYTTQGGLLYLLNMLNRTEMRTLMLDHAEHLPSGWLWLYRLGQELSLREDDPLADFIAKQLGLENRDELAYLPALPDRSQVLELAQRWYGKTGVWHADLLALSAEIRYTPSHIDMYAAMKTIRLPVRLAGLDINPGWLPWLGSVVNFHYD